MKRHGVERAGRTPRMRKEGRRTGGRGQERQEQIRGRPRQVRGRGEARGRPWGEEIRGIGGKRVGGFRATVVGRNKRLFTKKEERSGKGERGENEGQDVTRRNATGRRLNPVGKLGGGKVGRNNRLRFSETHPRRCSKGFNRRPVVLRRVTSSPSVAPLSPSPDLSSFCVNNRLFRPTTVSKNPRVGPLP